MLDRIRLALVAVMVVAAPASAAVVTGQFAGTAYDGTDGSGVFGAPGADLAMSGVTGSYCFDTDLITSMVNGSVNTGTGRPGALSVLLTVAGRGVLFTDGDGSSVTIDASTGEIDLSLSDSSDGYGSLQLGVVPSQNGFTGTDLAQAFASSSFNFTLGSFVIANAQGEANGNFTLQSINQSVAATDIPEPSSAILLLAGLGGLVAGRMRSGGTTSSNVMRP